jgi:hypothetical protein
MHYFFSSIRRVNLRVLFSVVFLGSLCYYAGWLSRWPAPDDSGLEWKDFEAKRVTITVQAPQATVTVIPEVEEAVVLNGSPTDAFQGMSVSRTAFERSLKRVQITCGMMFSTLRHGQVMDSVSYQISMVVAEF